MKKTNPATIHQFGRKANVVSNLLLGILAISCIFPLFFVIIISLTSEQSILMNGYSLWPKDWSLQGYHYLATMKGQLLQSLLITFIVTIFGTVVNVFFTSTYAYAISRPNFQYRRFFTIFALLSMLFSPGLVPSYIVVSTMLHLKDTIWALILPLALSPFNIILMRTFFKRTVSESIIESARIDGASELRIFLQIVLPLALPGIATISLFAALRYWNDWFHALLYVQSDYLMPLQYLLMKIQSNIDYMSQNATIGANLAESMGAMPKEATRMAMVVISTVPIACIYPFFQKYFVKGLTIGGVKE
ncbi:carbohydrate ABC transporter permease [Enterococcus faecalis]|uniref:carbohydrate ABC transporter permease n=1 Tax=Enterococcus sp. C92 TaxID=3231348 RepID=UPI00032F30A8|nr:carbohydrate ABC transporter permease [Enterococcus faecalis]EOJ68063.1 ABC transporter permease [Enterococcus faecalis EnGen0351]MDN3128659.1 carbohydrate ABC transporter permease [Enterococcus faecalis]MDT2111257.1 carbohydrate ABC transporter permease [Enterococcus faecalis]MDV7818453.1 carbohydrate ABC transporter permease [Enterococcus faecalis]MEB5872970.1 carbohydrate ABC transporter permease [Enterococcus faecalis]